MENYAQVQLTANGYRTYYWESARGAEVDFVIQREGKLIPIEVKAADNTRAKSLKVYMDTYQPDYAIKLSAKNFGLRTGKRPSHSTLRFAYSRQGHRGTLTDSVGVLFVPAQCARKERQEEKNS